MRHKFGKEAAFVSISRLIIFTHLVQIIFRAKFLLKSGSGGKCFYSLTRSGDEIEIPVPSRLNAFGGATITKIIYQSHQKQGMDTQERLVSATKQSQNKQAKQTNKEKNVDAFTLICQCQAIPW